jgi:hypothetical protein
MRQFADSTRTSVTPTLAHGLLLLAFDAEAGVRCGRSLDHGVVGGLLGELSLRGLIRLTPAALQLSPIADEALQRLRVVSPALGSVLEQLLATHESYSLAEWVAVLSLRGAELRYVLLRELHAAGVLSTAAASGGQVEHVPRSPTVLNPEPARRLRERLRAVALRNLRPEPRDRLQLSLLRACALERDLFQPHEWQRARRHLYELTGDEPLSNAVCHPCRPHARFDWQAWYPEGRLVEALAWLGLPDPIVERLAFFWRR